MNFIVNLCRLTSLANDTRYRAGASSGVSFVLDDPILPKKAFSFCYFENHLSEGRMYSRPMSHMVIFNQIVIFVCQNAETNMYGCDHN